MNDPYLYPNTDILINKFDIHNLDTLNSLEADFTSSRLKDIIQHGIIGNFDLEHFLKFHYTIFQDLYFWAGTVRTIDIEKPEPALGGISIEYSKFKDIESDIISILYELKSINWQLLNVDEVALTFSKHMAALWRVHPFREGNTRTVITFLCDYASIQGFPLDTDLLKDHSDYVRNSLVAASAIFHDLGDKSNLEYLVAIIKDAIERGQTR